MTFVERRINYVKAYDKQIALLRSIRKRSDRRLVEKVIKDLDSLSPFIYHVSKWGSIYLKFENYKWSMRIGDHSAIDKYNYKINLHTEDTDKYWLKINGEKRSHHFHVSNIDECIKFVLSGESQSFTFAKKETTK